jgi:tRNA (adenine57-N1/adenine58-N1)-methyltransferase catalytic subunit
MNPRRGPFASGDHAQLRGPKGTLHTITLEPGGSFHTHKGFLSHDDLIGQPEGSVVLSSNQVPYLALRPLLGDFVLSMARGATIIYPKDAAHIVSLVDIAPGHSVVEAGVGSGALTLSLLRGVGAEGSVISIERREEFAEIAQANVTSFLGKTPENWSCWVGDFQDRVGDVPAHSIDRIVLDMLAPWECIEGVTHALRPGGVLGVYVATVTQLSRVAEAIRESGRFTSVVSEEVIVRPWHVEGLAVRPEHRMIGHTGFILTARVVPEGVAIPPLKTHHQKPEYSVEDIEAWTPGATGQRVANDKTVRKKVREAQARAQRSLAAEIDPS